MGQHQCEDCSEYKHTDSFLDGYDGWVCMPCYKKLQKEGIA